MLAQINKYIISRINLLLDKKEKFLIRLLSPIKDFLDADIISILGLLSSVFAAYFIRGNHLLFIIFSIIKRIADILDGTVARLNGKHIFENLNMDVLCDLGTAFFTFLGVMPILGIPLPAIGIVIYFIHVIFDHGNIKHSIFCPAFPALYFFLFRLFSLGIWFQIIWSVFAFLAYRLTRGAT